jgi:hypothetical protein
MGQRRTCKCILSNRSAGHKIKAGDLTGGLMLEFPLQRASLRPRRQVAIVLQQAGRRRRVLELELIELL